MVSVTFKVDRQNHCTGFVCSGHAKYRRSGLDIVCAAISVLTQTIANSLETVVGVPLRYEADEKRGYFECNWELLPEKAGQCELLIKTLRLGLSAIQEEYPDHISLCEMEVESK